MPRFNISFYRNITKGRGKIVTSYFTISRLLISTQHYFNSHLGDFNFDESGDNIVEDYNLASRVSLNFNSSDSS